MAIVAAASPGRPNCEIGNDANATTTLNSTQLGEAVLKGGACLVEIFDPIDPAESLQQINYR